jgi:hypothetical protein
VIQGPRSESGVSAVLSHEWLEDSGFPGLERMGSRFGDWQVCWLGGWTKNLHATKARHLFRTARVLVASTVTA